VKGQKSFETEYLFNLLLEVSSDLYIGAIKVPIRSNNWDVETYMNKAYFFFIRIEDCNCFVILDVIANVFVSLTTKHIF
jgi:hypothetical protein